MADTHKIVDQNGQPFKREALKEQQTARLGWIASEFAEHPSRGLTPDRLHRLLTNAEQGQLDAQADLFADMEEKDAHLYAEMSKRKRAMLTLDWRIEPPPRPSAQEKRDAEALEEWLRDRDDLEDVQLDALDAIGQGFSAQTIEWEFTQKLWLPREITFYPQRNFQTLPTNTNELRLRNTSMDGEALWPFGWILHRHKAKSGYVGRAGLYRVLTLPWLFKNFAIRDLADFLDIYGIPMRIGKYPQGAGDAEQDTLLHAITLLGRRAGGIMPQGMDVEIKEAAKGTHDPFAAMIDWAERSMSKAILGGTLTSQADGKTSTNATAQVHNEVRHELKVSDARQLAATLTRDLVYPLHALNQANADPTRRFRWVFDTREIEDIKLLADSIPPLVQVGVRIPEKWVREKLAIPDQDGDETMLAQAVTPQPAALGRQFAARYQAALAAAPKLPAAPSPYPDQAALDVVADSLPAALTTAFDKMLTPVIKLVQNGASAEEALAELSGLYPDMDGGELHEALARIFFVADVWGRISDANA